MKTEFLEPMRILAVSDLHADFGENRRLLERLPMRHFQGDVLIVAGDIADQYERIRDTLSLLRSRFSRVFYVPGNHELWVRTERSDSVEKLFALLKLCDELGVETEPARIGNVWIVPLLSWYDPEFDDADGHDDTEELECWADFRFCRWPFGESSITEFFSGMNKGRIRAYEGLVISFSHFVPRRDLLPSRDRLRFKALPKVAGCHSIDAQIRELGARIHVFGHSHINLDCVIDGVRYVQNAVSYPRERFFTEFPVKVIWDFDSQPAVS